MLALVSCTANQKKTIVKGILAVKIMLVGRLPNSGLPEDSSKTEPTPAIAAIQDPNNNTPLFGVTKITPDRQQKSLIYLI
jgi:hypothetical protein